MAADVRGHAGVAGRTAIDRKRGGGGRAPVGFTGSIHAAIALFSCELHLNRCELGLAAVLREGRFVWRALVERLAARLWRVLPLLAREWPRLSLLSGHLRQ